MSWIVTLLKLKGTSDDVPFPEDWETRLLPLGTKSEILALLKTWFPEAEYDDLSWISVRPSREIREVLLSGNDLNSDESPILSLGFRNPSYRILRDVCAKMGWVAFNPSDGQLMQFDTSPESFRHPHAAMANRISAFPIEQVINLRNTLVNILQTNEAQQLAEFRTILYKTINDIEISPDGVFLTVLDHLRYVADYPQIANRNHHVPSEDQIRQLQPR